MKRQRKLGFVSVIGFMLLGTASLAGAETPRFFGSKSPQEIAAGSKVEHADAVLECKGEPKFIRDVAIEPFLFTPFNFNPANGGGEGGCFDPTPVLTTTVSLPTGYRCLNAHFSTIVASPQFYGPSLAPLAVFQVTLTPLTGGPPQHMIGHFETPYNLACPAVAIEAETDVDTFGSNFFQTIGTGRGDIPPGNYRVDVWWAGAPPFGTGGVSAAAFVLKLYGG